MPQAISHGAKKLGLYARRKHFIGEGPLPSVRPDTQNDREDAHQRFPSAHWRQKINDMLAQVLKCYINRLHCVAPLSESLLAVIMARGVICGALTKM